MTRQNKARAIILSALMVFSVFAGTMAIAGSVSATIERGGNGNIEYDVNSESGDVGDGAIIFQGEDDITIRDADGDRLSPAQFQRAAEAGGETLSLPVAQDAPTGTYTATGISEGGGGGGTANGIINLTVDSPRISTFDVNNNNGEDVNGGVLRSDQTNAAVIIDFNFADSENITLTVEDEGGVDVTNEFLRGSARDSVNATTVNGANNTINPAGAADTDDGDLVVKQDGGVAIPIDPGGVDAGEYTFTAEGDDDFAFDDASQSTTVSITTSQQASLTLTENSASQGSNVDFTIDDSVEGSFHAVIIPSTEFRDNINSGNVEQIFRNVGDTSDTGLLNVSSGTFNTSTNSPVSDIEAAYAIVEIDGGSGVGSIETQFIDDSSTTVEVLPAQSTTTNYNVDSDGVLTGTANILNENVDDDQDLEVTEGTVQLGNPSDTYVVGQDVDVNGSVSEGTDRVAIYARDRGSFQLVQLGGTNVSNVDADDTFEEEDITLSQSDDQLEGNQILSLPGSYRIGIIDVQSALDISRTTSVATTSTVGIPLSISASDFNGGISNSESLVVTDTELESSLVTYNGQIATEDESNAIDVSGRAPGQSDIGVIFVGPRGNVDGTTVSVDNDDTFSEQDISISSLAEGTVSAHVLSEGRDGDIGDEFNTSVGNFVNFVTGGGFQGSADQVRDRVLSNTVDDTASDDIMDTTTFRKADGLTTLETVSSPVSSNGTIEVQGQTNRKADDNTIVLELLDQEDTVIASTSTDQWGTNGTYSASIELEGVAPGEYQLSSDDGDNTDRAPVEVVDQVEDEEETATATPEDTPTPEPDTPTPTEEPADDTPTPTEEPADDTPTESDAGTPGFGIVVALTALIAAALLAVRRTN